MSNTAFLHTGLHPCYVLFTSILLAALAGCASGPASETSGQEDGAGRPARIEESTRVEASVRVDFEAALALLKEEKYEKGIELLASVSRRAPNSSAPYINLAIAQQNIGKLDAAEENLKKALAISPSHPVANNEYAILLRRTGRIAEARKTLEEVLKKHPHFAAAHKNLAILCDLYLKDYDCALKNYQLYGAATPDDKKVEIWIADVSKRAGR
jgi:tetratricopeptide (TPR) repeat protein